METHQLLNPNFPWVIYVNDTSRTTCSPDVQVKCVRVCNRTALALPRVDSGPGAAPRWHDHLPSLAGFVHFQSLSILGLLAKINL